MLCFVKWDDGEMGEVSLDEGVVLLVRLSLGRKVFKRGYYCTLLVLMLWIWYDLFVWNLF